MIDIPVASVMSGPPPHVSPATTTVEAARFLRQPDVPALVVRDSTGAVVGVVTESDIVAVVAERGGDCPVATFMSTPVVTTSPSTPIGLAADRMRDAGVTLLPVVDDGTFDGVVTKDDLTPYLSRRRLETTWQREPVSLDPSPAVDGHASERPSRDDESADLLTHEGTSSE